MTNDQREAWDWSEPCTFSDGTTHYRETCDCLRCVKDRPVSDRIRRSLRDT